MSGFNVHYVIYHYLSVWCVLNNVTSIRDLSLCTFSVLMFSSITFIYTVQQISLLPCSIFDVVKM